MRLLNAILQPECRDIQVTATFMQVVFSHKRLLLGVGMGKRHDAEEALGDLLGEGGGVEMFCSLISVVITWVLHI